MEFDFEGADIRKPLLWCILSALLKLAVDAEREYRAGQNVRYLAPAVEKLAWLMRRQMAFQNERLDTMRHNLVKSDPCYAEAMAKLGLPFDPWEDTDTDIHIQTPVSKPAPAPWAHDWTEDDAEFEDDETEEETGETAPKNRGK